MKTHTSTTPLRRTLALGALALLGTVGLLGCRGERSDEPPHQFLPDMDDSPKFKPQTEAEFFADGRAMRPRVKGAVAFGDSYRIDDVGRAKYLRSSPELWDGVDPNGKPFAEGEPSYVGRMPASALEQFRAVNADRGMTWGTDAEAMRAMILRGQERFNIYCSVCHGYQGEGSDPVRGTGGIVGRRWKTPVPTYHDPKYSDKSVKTGQDGYIFSVIRNGVPDTDAAKPLKMPSYADKVSEIDAWAVVAYIRTLQAAWKETAPPAAAPKPAPANPGVKP